MDIILGGNFFCQECIYRPVKQISYDKFGGQHGAFFEVNVEE
jgi:hypothetical protein